MSYKHDRLKQIETETREGKRFPCPQCDGTGQRCEGGADGRPVKDDEGRLVAYAAHGSCLMCKGTGKLLRWEIEDWEDMFSSTYLWAAHDEGDDDG